MGYARVTADGDILPLRAKYGGNDWQIGVKMTPCEHGRSRRGAVVLVARFRGLGAADGETAEDYRGVQDRADRHDGRSCKAVRFRGQVPIDPRTQDFFKVVIEERMRLPKRKELSEAERDRLKRSLKTFGSATSSTASGRRWIGKRAKPKLTSSVTGSMRHPTPAACSIPNRRVSSVFRHWPR